MKTRITVKYRREPGEPYLIATMYGLPEPREIARIDVGLFAGPKDEAIAYFEAAVNEIVQRFVTRSCEASRGKRN